MNLYFDNGATSTPKPAAVLERISEYLELGGSYGRSASERSLKVADSVERCRELMADRLGVSNGDNISFTSNATTAINLVVNGMKLSDSTVYISPLEHNSVMRPLKALEDQNVIKIKLLPADQDGRVKVDDIKLDCDCSLVIVSHASNLNGVIQPVADIKSKIGSTPMLLDVAQSGGSIPIMGDNWGVEFIAFTGHKGFMGPTGIGGLYIKDHRSISPSVLGGTGSASDSFDMPQFMPDRFEAGTPNIVGIYGLLGALESEIESLHTKLDYSDLLDKIGSIPSITIYGGKERSEIFSIVSDKLSVSEISYQLYDRFNIETRSGLLCSPQANRYVGTFPEGVCRLSLSPFHSKEDLDYLYRSLRSIFADNI